jgi:hypothetical protein
MTRFPDQHFSASVLCNFADTDPSALVLQVADIILAKDLKTPAPTGAKEAATSVPVTSLTGEQMGAIAGNYWNGEDEFAKVVVKDGKLMLDVNRDDFHELKQFAPGHFHVADESWGEQLDLHFIAADGAKPRRIEESFDGGKSRDFNEVKIAELTAAQLAEYAGAYVSEEIDPVYRMVIENGTVMLMRLKHNPDALRPAARDVFVADVGKIRFTRDANQHVNGFVLDADRIQNLSFTKRAY